MFKYVHLYVDLFPPPLCLPYYILCRSEKGQDKKRTKRNKQTEPNEQKQLSQLNFKH